MVANLATKYHLSEAEYLEGEKTSEIKHEYSEGDVYAMAGASRNHNIISSNIARQLGNHLENTPCTTFVADMKVKANDAFYYPDVLVVCDDDKGDDYYTEFPVIIIEVLSNSTRGRDKVTKMNAYRTIPTLQEYVLIEQNFVDIEICRRSSHWQSKHYFLGDKVTFESLEITLSVESIYQRVVNEEMLELQRKVVKT
ncbi:MAG: Uma2 family endonuclease [Methylococcales bacterium]|nr:Uma2 family endonuclease [Methylococcales bacterium]